MNRRLLVVLLLGCLVSSACLRNREVFYFGSYSEAERLFNKKQYAKAIPKYQAALDENPEGNLAVISMYYMAKSHQALGHVEDARALYQKIIKDHPDLDWANFSETHLKEMEGKVSPPSLASEPEKVFVPKVSLLSRLSGRLSGRKWYYLYLK